METLSQVLPYRRDIDGLRALAVVAVICYHLGMAAVPGGFVGVDVFFVISGFLISGGIQRDIAAGRFKLLDFYDRRFRRIFPALFAMMALTWIAAWFLFLPDDYRSLGGSMVAATLFVSNFLFWIQADYFTGPVDLKPLVHTWSLAVEEQFYILLPLLLWGVARFLRGRFLMVTLVVAIASFLASVAMVRLAPSAAFYLLPSRGWELLAGALLSQPGFPQIRRRWVAEGAGAIALAMIVGSMLLLTAQSDFPGANALFPCVGAALIIHCGSTVPGTVAARLLGWAPLRWIGLISYSLYLWHWPLIVFARYALLTSDLPLTATAAVAAATFLMAWLSWRYVEQPFRAGPWSRRATVTASLSAMGLFSALGIALLLTNGAAFRFAGKPVPQIARADQPLPGEPRCFLEKGFDEWAGPGCFLSRKSGPTTLIWSDSHGSQYRQAIRKQIGPRVAGSILLYANGGCPPLFGVAVYGRPYCQPNNDHVRAIIAEYHVSRVVLAARWGATLADNRLGFDQLERTIQMLRDQGLDVWLIGDNPEYAFNNMPLLARRVTETGENRSFLMTPMNSRDWNSEARAIIGVDRFIDPMAALCPSGRQCLVIDKGQPVMSNFNHLSFYGARIVARGMMPAFDNVAVRRAEPAGPPTR